MACSFLLKEGQAFCNISMKLNKKNKFIGIKFDCEFDFFD